VEGFDSMVEAFQCYGPQGVAGCGFESHLESMYLALAAASSDDSQTNYGFLRDSAILSVVVISDETDCSYSPGAKEIFTTNKVFWNDPDNDVAPTSAMCWKAGVQCRARGRPTASAHAENYDLKGMPGAADADAVLRPVQRTSTSCRRSRTQKQRARSVAGGAGVDDRGRAAGLREGRGGDRVRGLGRPGVPGQLRHRAGLRAAERRPERADSTAVPPVREREFAEAFANTSMPAARASRAARPGVKVGRGRLVHAGEQGQADEEVAGVEQRAVAEHARLVGVPEQVGDEGRWP
jgi:hypothetical protein